MTLRMLSRKGNHFDLLSDAVNTFALSSVLEARNSLPAHQVLERMYGGRRLEKETLHNPLTYEYAGKILTLSVVFGTEIRKPAGEWASDLTPWNNLVEEARSLFGHRWAFDNLANIAAAAGSKDEKYDNADDLHDASVPLCQRARRARLRSGSPNWWRHQIEHAGNDNAQIFALLLFFSWAGPETLKKLVDIVNPILHSLAESSWQQLFSSLRQSRHLAKNLSSQVVHFDNGDLPPDISDRTAVAYSIRADDASKVLIYRTYASRSKDKSASYLSLAGEVTSILLREGATGWEKGLPIIESVYKHYHGRSFRVPLGYVRNNERGAIPADLAIKVVQNPELYPCDIVAIAEMKNRELLASSVVPVGKVAAQEHWFDDIT